MGTEVKLSAEGRYVLLKHTGALRADDLINTLKKPLPSYDYDDSILVDFSSASLSRISLLELDDFGTSFRQEVLACRRLALVSGSKTENAFFSHLANLLIINGIEVELFEEIKVAKAWLLNE